MHDSEWYNGEDKNDLQEEEKEVEGYYEQLPILMIFLLMMMVMMPLYGVMSAMEYSFY